MGKRYGMIVVAVLVAGGLLVAGSLSEPPRASARAAGIIEEHATSPAAAPAAPAAPATSSPATSSPATSPLELPDEPPVEPPVVAKPSYLAAGIHEHHVQIDGQTRRWTTVVPGGPDGRVPAALVVVLHGVGGRGVDMRSAGFEPLAASFRAVVAYPDAHGGAWNDGRPGTDPAEPGVTVDDTHFLRVLIDETAARTGADFQRVAVVGFSNGAVMAGRVACELSDRVAAVALVAGSAGQGFEQSCRPAHPVSMMLVAGSNDRTVPYGGGRVADWGTRRRGYVAAVDDFFAFWRGQAACASLQGLPGPAQVSAARGAECRRDATVVRYRVNGGGHEWYRPPTFDTTNMVWDFVAKRLAA